MITVANLAQELNISEEEILNQAVSLQINLRSRGKSLVNADAERLRALYQEKSSEEAEAQAGKEDADDTDQVALPLVINVKDLAEKLDVGVATILKTLIDNGVIANINDELDFDTAGIIAEELGFTAIEEHTAEEEEVEEVVITDNRLAQLLQEQDPQKLKPRPPIVTIMGHVDHGKTSLLDAIRSAKVAEGEHGGITQHIGAYQVMERGKRITFIDTPGHEAFTQMRARGAQVTDVVILIVAADDGVKPQTQEAYHHAKAAEVPIIVAINKIDKPGADIDRVKSEISELGLVPEDWGGTTVVAPISAKKREGIDELLDMILLVAEMEELKGNPDRFAVGTIVEAKKHPQKGVLATVLVQTGSLRVGDPILVGSASGRIKSMHDDKNHKVKVAGPGDPVEFTGLSDTPEAGSILQVVESDRQAQQIADMLERRERAQRLRPTRHMSLEHFAESAEGEGGIKILNVILKTDVRGSAEAIKDSFRRIETDEVKVNVLHDAPGDITASDVALAEASNAVIMGFHVKVAANAIEVVRKSGIEVRTYSVIYQLIEDVQQAMGGLLGHEDIQILKGRMEVKAVFTHTRDRWTVGGIVTAGEIRPSDRIIVQRGEEVLSKAEIISLKRESVDVDVVKDGIECGIMLKRLKQPIQVGDTLNVYITEKRKRELYEK